MRTLILVMLVQGTILFARQPMVVIPKKTEMFVVLERALDSKTATPGDRFQARISVPVTVNDQIVIPVRSYILGQVESVKKPGYFKGKAKLRLSFDTVIFPGGKTRQLAAVTRSAEGHSTGQGSDEGQIIAAGSQGDQTVGGATAGAVAGGAIGAIAGKSVSGFGVGAAVGAATGALVGLSMKGKHVRLPRGAAVTIQLDDDATLIEPQRQPGGKKMRP